MINQDLIDLKNEIVDINSLDDAWYLLCKISYITEQDNNNIKIQNIVNILESIFSNTYLIELIENSYFDYFAYTQETENKETQESRKLIDDRKTIKIMLLAWFFLIWLNFESIEEVEIVNIRYSISNSIKTLSEKLESIPVESLSSYLAYILYNPKYNSNHFFPLERIWVPMRKQIDDKHLFNISKKTSVIGVISILQIYTLKHLSNCIKAQKDKTLRSRLNKLYASLMYTQWHIEKSIEFFEENFWNKEGVIKFIQKYSHTNEEVCKFIIKHITSWFYSEDRVEIRDLFNGKLITVPIITKSIKEFCKEKLSAFNSNNSKKTERSNKIFIVTIELLEVIKIAHEAKDREWTYNVCHRSFAIRLEHINEILNKYDIEDELHLISDYIRNENKLVEWKSSFFIDTESWYINDQAEKSNAKKMIEIILKNIVWMMNSEGWNIIIWLCEYPKKISRPEVLNNIIIRNGITFFDVSVDLEKAWFDYDKFRLHLQELLSNYTDENIDILEKLRSIKPIELRDDKTFNRATIYKINVEKSEKLIFQVEKNSKSKALRLIRRIDWQTIYVDPRDYIQTT
jgi:hypothetical protein